MYEPKGNLVVCPNCENPQSTTKEWGEYLLCEKCDRRFQRTKKISEFKCPVCRESRNLNPSVESIECKNCNSVYTAKQGKF